MIRVGASRHQTQRPVLYIAELGGAQIPVSYASGSRLRYDQLPTTIQNWARSLVPAGDVEIVDYVGGFSPGVTASLTSGRSSIFVKVIAESMGVDSLKLLQREWEFGRNIPDIAVARRPLERQEFVIDSVFWLALSFPLLDGATPEHPWTSTATDMVFRALDAIRNCTPLLRPVSTPDRAPLSGGLSS